MLFVKSQCPHDALGGLKNNSELMKKSNWANFYKWGWKLGLKERTEQSDQVCPGLWNKRNQILLDDREWLRVTERRLYLRWLLSSPKCQLQCCSCRERILGRLWYKYSYDEIGSYLGGKQLHRREFAPKPRIGVEIETISDTALLNKEFRNKRRGRCRC